MLILGYLIGLIGAALLSFLIYLLNGWLNIQLHSLTILFIIPIGGLLIGGICALILGRGKKIVQKKMVKLDLIAAIILGLFSFFFVDYISYYTTYITEDSSGNIDVVNSFSDKRGYIQLKDYISYVDYMDMVNSSSSMQLRFKGVQMGDDIEVGRTGTIIALVLQIIGVIIGAYMMMRVQQDSSAYCETCKKYKKTKLLKTIDPQGTDAEELSTKLKQIYEYRGNIPKLKELLDSIKDTDSSLYKQGEKYFTLSLVYCENCHLGDLILSLFVVGNDGSNLESSSCVELVGLVNPLLEETGKSSKTHKEENQELEKSEVKKKKTVKKTTKKEVK